MQTLQYAIALTGGIGSGKSTVCNFLKLYGYSIIDADSIAHSVLEECKEEIIALFGSEILIDSQINRKKLGNIIFHSKEKRQLLQDIMHPKIKEYILKEARKQESKKTPYFIDIPLFFECQAKEETSYPIGISWLVYAPKDLQIKRLMQRNSYTKEEALERISAQMPLDDKIPLSDFIIYNDRGLEELQEDIERTLKDTMDKFFKKD